MKIDKITINEYDKGFISETNLGKTKFLSRYGWYIKIYSGTLCGIGEAAPIPGISSETHEEVGYALNGFKLSLQDIDYDIDLEELLLLSDIHGFNINSSKFAIECAIYDLFSKYENKSIAEYIEPNFIPEININAIYSNRSTILPTDVNILKIKINNNNVFDIIEKVDMIVSCYNDDIKLRLDFNEGLDLARSIRVCKQLESYNIDYIEQPLSRLNIHDYYDLRMSVDMPIGLDESVTDYQSVVELIDEGAVDVLVVKPTITGSLKDIKNILDLSNQEKIRLVISSSFETSIAQNYICNLIAAFGIKEHCGIHNIKLFKKDSIPILHKDQIRIPIEIGNS